MHREAVAAGIDLPVELRSLTTSADKKAGSVAAGGAPNAILRTDALGEKASGVSLLLQLQRKGDHELKQGLESLLFSSGGEAAWLDFVKRRLPHQMHALMVGSSSGSGGAAADGAAVGALPARTTRRQLALLLSRLLRWRLPEKARLKELLEPLPESLRARRRSNSAQQQSSIELEDRCTSSYLHGSGYQQALGTGGVGGGLLPNVTALASALLRRACTEEALTGRESASRILNSYSEWWPVTSLQQEGRRLIHSADSTDKRSVDAAVCCLELLP